MANDRGPSRADQVLEPWVEVAVGWWQDVLRRQPMKDTLGHGAPAGRREHGEVLGTLIGVKNAPDEATIARFGLELSRIISDPQATFLSRDWETGAAKESKVRIDSNSEFNWHTLGCDYHPDALLWSAAQRAGMTNALVFPWKTTMWLEPGYVAVSAGYGAELRILHETPEHKVQRLTRYRDGCRYSLETLLERLLAMSSQDRQALIAAVQAYGDELVRQKEREQ